MLACVHVRACRFNKEERKKRYREVAAQEKRKELGQKRARKE